jgi:enoyl-CoA hydratase
MEAQEALAIGLVNRVVPREALLAQARELADRIASLPAKAVRNAKAAVVRGQEVPLAEGLLLERRLARATRRP